ncbi:MAG: class I mannose-6-phosphate isomerase [Tannerellaceae bacterium]|jgi:mannose-6-phosphate isomerase|nr:class I mannose-6-phosphate isomerase [Tannerellaceae bacterium]
MRYNALYKTKPETEQKSAALPVIKSQPQDKAVLWGGNKIHKFKYNTSSMERIGESWEIFPINDYIPGKEKADAATSAKGMKPEELKNKFLDELLGASVRKAFGDNFPLLIKFIDATDKLSIQVHPNDELAHKRHKSPGKTEMWYVIEAEDGAFVHVGFNKSIDKDEFRRRVEDNTLEEVLKRHPAKAGDVFFVPAGQVHGIGSGCLIAEIQQASDITYRIYDYGRKDADGNTRELHLEDALNAIDFNADFDSGQKYELKGGVIAALVKCRYFNTNIIQVSKEYHRDARELDSFIVYICIGGQFEISYNNVPKVEARKGEVILIPASAGNVIIRPLNGEVKLIETYVPINTGK